MGLLALALVCNGAAGLRAAEVPQFERDIAPILTRYCAGCHNAEEANGELSLESFAALQQGGEHGPVLVPGDPAASRLLQVLAEDAELRMPPEDEPAPGAAERELLQRWIAAGAPGPAADTPPLAQPEMPALPPTLTPKPITAIAFSPEGRLLAIGRYGSVQLVTAEGQRHVRHLDGLAGKVASLQFTPDGRQLLVASGIAGRQGQAALWDLNSGQVVQTWQGHRDILYDAALSPTGQLIATASYDRAIILWDRTGRQLRTLQGHNGAVFDVAFSPDGQLLASASADATVKIWRVDTGERLDTLSQPLQEQLAVDISPDGQWVIAAGADNRIRKWRLISRERPEINPLVIARYGHEQAIQCARFSPDGSRIVSASADRSLKVWDTASMQQLASFDDQPDNVQTLAFADDGTRIAVGRMDGSLQVYELPAPAAEIPTDSVATTARPEITIAKDAPLMVSDEAEPNDTFDAAQDISLPARIQGTIGASASTGAGPDVDFYQITCQAGQSWVIEIDAARSQSPLDSHLAVLTPDGQPVPRVLLRAVRDSYFTFRGKNSEQTGDFRLHNWREMRINQYLYASGEVVKLYHYPRGPDSGFNVYPNFGQRHAYFGTSPLAHSLHEPCYIVEPHPPGTQLEPNGLPTFVIPFANDDDGLRQLGSDSRLTFTAPAAGTYLIRVQDVRGMGGKDFRYQLIVRPPQPDFQIHISRTDPVVPRAGGHRFDLRLERQDGFEGPVRIDVEGVPPGFEVTTPIEIEAGQLRAWGTLTATDQTPAPDSMQAVASRLIATAEIHGQTVRKEIGTLGEIKLGDLPAVQVELTPPAGDQTDEGIPILEIPAGQTATATIRVARHRHDGPIAFGNEEALFNMPHGVYVDNIGLNGVLIPADQTERVFFITVEPWVKASERLVFVEAQVSGNPTSFPILLRIVPQNETPGDEHADQLSQQTARDAS